MVADRKKRSDGLAREIARRGNAARASRGASETDRSVQAVDVGRLLESVLSTDRNLMLAAQRRDRAVFLARVGGASWAQIGQALGISAQAAHRRYADLVAEIVDAAAQRGHDAGELLQ